MLFSRMHARRQASPVLRTNGINPVGTATSSLILAFYFLLLISACGLLFLFFMSTSQAVVDLVPMVSIPNRQQLDTPNIKTKTKTNAEAGPPKVPIQSIRQEFYSRYGGTQAGKTMQQKGVTVYGGSDSIDATAQRMLQAAAHERPFVVAFGGYSVTVGRGNYFQQSFPFVMERILNAPLQEILGVPLKVRNGAIGGIPSFPYGWCLDHFLGNDADVISWDYGMNEGSGAAVLESYIRQGMRLPNQPMFILIDNNKQRTNLLQEYVKRGILNDAISVSRAEGVVDKSLFVDKPDNEKPLGFLNWDEFGAPKRCPGRSSWHPKKMEHELLGWMLAMHLLDALERAHAIMRENPDHWKQAQLEKDANIVELPPPLNQPPHNEKSVTQLMYGHQDEKSSTHVLKDISCRTSFLPAVDHEKVLPSLVVSGTTKDMDMDIMLERGNDAYQSGWVLDISKVERETKVKVEKCGGLGYIDMKVALYGIPESGPLRLWLPYEAPSHLHASHDHTNKDDDDDVASHWFDDLVICEANEKRDEKACKLDSDIKYVVGGVDSPGVSSIDGAGVYLKRKTCYNIQIPIEAKVTLFKNVKSLPGETALSAVASSRLRGQTLQDDDLGLIVDIHIVGDDISRANGACCLSHIVWEQH